MADIDKSANEQQKKSRGRPKKPQPSEPREKKSRGRPKGSFNKLVTVNPWKTGCRPHWTLNEKKLLIKGLKQYGVGDLDSIVKVTGRTKNEILYYIRNRSVKLGNQYKITKRVKNSAIELWQQHMYYIMDNKSKKAEYAPMFAEIFGEASTSEPHLVPQHENEPNFATINNYMKDIFMGNIPPILSSSESLVVLQLLQSVSQILRKMGIDKEKEFLGSLMPTRDPLLWTNCADFRENYVNKEKHLKSKKGKRKEKVNTEEKNESDDKLPKELGEAFYFYKNVIGSLNPLMVPVSLLESQNMAFKECLNLL